MNTPRPDAMPAADRLPESGPRPTPPPVRFTTKLSLPRKLKDPLRRLTSIVPSDVGRRTCLPTVWTDLSAVERRAQSAQAPGQATWREGAAPKPPPDVRPDERGGERARSRRGRPFTPPLGAALVDPLAGPGH